MTNIVKTMATNNEIFKCIGLKKIYTFGLGKGSGREDYYTASELKDSDVIIVFGNNSNANIIQSNYSAFIRRIGVIDKDKKKNVFVIQDCRDNKGSYISGNLELITYILSKITGDITTLNELEEIVETYKVNMLYCD